MKHGSVKALTSALAIVLFLNVAGCGYIMHPERRGQTGGNLDPAIVLMDGIGILLFVVPGVIAFVVDFSSGAIYYPGGRHSVLAPNDMRQVRFDVKHATPAMIERIVLEQTGVAVTIDRNHVTVVTLRSLDEMADRLAAVWPAPAEGLLAGVARR